MSVYAVFADADEAAHIGRLVIEEHLAACVNILGPCRSIYRWKEALESAEEVPAIFKTGEDKVDALIARIVELHRYHVPCVTASKVDSLFEPYGEWIADALKPAP
jgi:periplasmic divalent cation tolerance protein